MSLTCRRCRTFLKGKQKKNLSTSDRSRNVVGQSIYYHFKLVLFFQTKMKPLFYALKSALTQYCLKISCAAACTFLRSGNQHFKIHSIQKKNNQIFRVQALLSRKKLPFDLLFFQVRRFILLYTISIGNIRGLYGQPLPNKCSQDLRRL